MGAFRRVEDAQAGPTALGILIPPSRRTFLILRPRSLSFDLLCLHQANETRFRELSHDEAAAAAHQLYQALRAWAAGGVGGIELVGEPDDRTWLRVRVGPLFLVACARVPGKPYQPVFFTAADPGDALVADLAAILCPPASVEQELYFNTRHLQA